MRIFISALVAFIVTSALWVLTLRYRPMWIAKIMLDENGFPRVKKTGDKYVVNGKTFFYNGSIWVELSSTTGFPVNPAPSEGDTFIINGVGYKYSGGVWNKITGPNGDPAEIVAYGNIASSSRSQELVVLRGRKKIINGTDWTWAVGLYYGNGSPVIPGLPQQQPKGGRCLVPYDGDGDGSQDTYNGVGLWHYIDCDNSVL